MENERAKSCMQIQVICFEITGVQVISTPGVLDSCSPGGDIALYCLSQWQPWPLNVHPVQPLSYIFKEILYPVYSPSLTLLFVILYQRQMQFQQGNQLNSDSLSTEMCTQNSPSLPVNVICGSGATTPGCSRIHPQEHASVCVHMQGRQITAFWTWRNHACLSVRLPGAWNLTETHCHLPGIGGSFRRPSSCRSGSFWVKLPSTAGRETEAWTFLNGSLPPYP